MIKLIGSFKLAVFDLHLWRVVVRVAWGFSWKWGTYRQGRPVPWFGVKVGPVRINFGWRTR